MPYPPLGAGGLWKFLFPQNPKSSLPQATGGDADNIPLVTLLFQIVSHLTIILFALSTSLLLWLRAVSVEATL